MCMIQRSRVIVNTVLLQVTTCKRIDQWHNLNIHFNRPGTALGYPMRYFMLLLQIAFPCPLPSPFQNPKHNNANLCNFSLQGWDVMESWAGQAFGINFFNSAIVSPMLYTAFHHFPLVSSVERMHLKCAFTWTFPVVP